MTLEPLPTYMSNCRVTPEEALDRIVRSGTCIASGFCTSEPHSFFNNLWRHIQQNNLHDIKIRQALFMAPHEICVGEALKTRGPLDAFEKIVPPKLLSPFQKTNTTLKKLRGLRTLIDHYRELERRRILFTTPFIGGALNIPIPENKLVRRLFPKFTGRNTTRMAVTDMQPLHFPDAFDTISVDDDGGTDFDAFVMVMTPPNDTGLMSHGPANAVNGEVLDLLQRDRRATLLLYLNSSYPFTTGIPQAPNTVHADKLKEIADENRLLVVEDDGPIPTAPLGTFRNPGPKEKKIAEHVVNHIETNKESTVGRALQVGIGRTGVQATRLLKDSSWSGKMYSEMLEPFTLELFEKGKISGSHFIESDGTRTELPGRLTCTFTLAEHGSDFYQRLHNNKAILLAPASQVVIPEGFFGGLGINNCLGIDFQGHVNAGGRDRNHHSGMGGHAMICRGLGNGGLSYLCMKSTHRTPDGEVRSSIFPYLPQGTPISLVGPDIMGTRHGGKVYLVTEFGVAQLSGRSQGEFIQEIIRVAHPEFRTWLKKKAIEEFRVIF